MVRLCQSTYWNQHRWKSKCMPVKSVICNLFHKLFPHSLWIEEAAPFMLTDAFVCSGSLSSVCSLFKCSTAYCLSTLLIKPFSYVNDPSQTTETLTAEMLDPSKGQHQGKWDWALQLVYKGGCQVFKVAELPTYWNAHSAAVGLSALSQT